MPIIEDSKMSVVSRDQLFNLEALVKGGLTNKFKKSFYHYKGSFSIPDCSGVDRIVMSSRIMISEKSYQAAEKIFRQDENIDNTRSIQNSESGEASK